jgi:hypothetical protein
MLSRISAFAGMTVFSKLVNIVQMASSKDEIFFVDRYDDYREVRLLVKKIEGAFSGDGLGWGKLHN